MTELSFFDDIDAALSAGARQIRTLLAKRLGAELAMAIDTLSTRSQVLATGDADLTDPDHFKSWALSFIDAVPTRIARAANDETF